MRKLSDKPLTVGPNGEDAYFAGDLDAALALMDDRVVIEEVGATGQHYIMLCDDDTRESCAEWGAGKTREEAMRYALGAYFGPMDEEYDESRLAASLAAGVWSDSHA